MIIFGFRRHIIHSEVDHGIECPHCQNHELGVELEVSRKHLHVFWIPTLPFKKRLRMKCLQCGKKIKLKELRDTLQIRLSNLKGKYRAPIWQFSGSFVLVLFVLLVTLVYLNHKDSDLDRIHNIESGDYVRYQNSQGSYSSYFVEAVIGDSIVMRPIFLSEENRSRVFHIEKEEYHSDSLIYWSRNDLINEFTKEGSVYSVRNY